MCKKISTLLLILGSVLSGCRATPSGSGLEKGQPEILLGIFQGVLPCADCPGIETRLTLTQEGKFIDIGHFTLAETYLERSVKPRVTQGECTVIKGTAQDENAVVYELRPNHSKPILYFLKQGETKVKQLDREGNEIASKINLTLRKIK